MWDFDLGSILLDSLETLDFIWDALRYALHVGFDIRTSLHDISSDVEGVTRGFGDCEPVVEGDATGDGTEANNHAPHLVNRKATDAAAGGESLGRLERVLEAGCDDQRNEAGTELTDTLHGEHRAHHGTSPFGGSEFGRDNGGQRVVATDAHAHQHAPEYDYADNRDGRRVGGKGLSQGGEDDDDELQTVHSFAADDISQDPEADLTDDCAGGSGDLDGGVGSCRDATFLRLCILPVDYAEKIGDQTDGEQVVCVGEEANAGDDDCSDMIPAKRGLVDLSKGETTTLVGISYVRLWCDKLAAVR